MRRKVIGWAAAAVLSLFAWFAAGSWLFVKLGGRPVAEWLATHGFWTFMAGWVYWGVWPTSWTRSIYMIAFFIPALLGVTVAASVPSLRDKWRLRRRLSPISADEQPAEIERANTSTLGNAKLMDDPTARQTFPGNSGKLVGIPMGGGPPLYDAMEASGVSLEIVGTRGFKTSRAAAMAAKWPNALAVFDPAAELAHMTWRMMTGIQGRTVWIMNPDRFPADEDGLLRPWSHLIGCTNVIGWIDKTDPMAEIYVHAATANFFDSEKIKTTHSGEFFEGTAESLIAALIAHIIWDQGIWTDEGTLIPPLPKDLQSMREFINLPPDDLRAALLAISKRSESQLARRYAGPLAGAHAETFGDIHNTVHLATRWLAMDVLADMVCGDDFDLRDLCHNPGMAVFVQIPMIVCHTFKNFAQVVFGSLMTAKMIHPGSTHVLAITDESWMLKARAIREIILNGGKYRVALHMFWQSVGDIDWTWGHELRGSFFDNAAWIAMGKLGDARIAREVSESCGHYGAISYSKGDSTSTQVGSFFSRQRGDNLNRHPVKVMVFYPHELMQKLHRGVRLILKLSDPLVVRSAPWWDIPELNGLIDPSPYEKRPDKPPRKYKLGLRKRELPVPIAD